MADIYSDTLTADSNTGDLTVVVGSPTGVTVTGPARIEVKNGTAYNQIKKMKHSESVIVLPTTSTMRIVDESGASNYITVEDNN